MYMGGRAGTFTVAETDLEETQSKRSPGTNWESKEEQAMRYILNARDKEAQDDRGKEENAASPVRDTRLAREQHECIQDVYSHGPRLDSTSPSISIRGAKKPSR